MLRACQEKYLSGRFESWQAYQEDESLRYDDTRTAYQDFRSGLQDLFLMGSLPNKLYYWNVIVTVRKENEPKMFTCFHSQQNVDRGDT